MMIELVPGDSDVRFPYLKQRQQLVDEPKSCLGMDPLLADIIAKGESGPGTPSRQAWTIRLILTRMQH
jgi:hypothetical protein